MTCDVSATGGRAGGGSGGSIYIDTDDFRGLGSITADGGSSVGTTTCPGGGGAGGRVAIVQTTNSYTGALNALATYACVHVYLACAFMLKV